MLEILKLFYEYFLMKNILIILIILNYYIIMRILNKILAQKNKLMIILGSGGHTGEMLLMIKKLDLNKFRKVYFVYSKNDSTSLKKLKETFPEIENNNKIKIFSIYRSRNVGQTYKSSILTTIYSFFEAFLIIFKTRPNLVS